MVSCTSPSAYCGDDFARVTGAGDNRLTVRSVKLFADGALGSRGAALLEEYSDQPGWNGLMLMPEDKWEGVIRKWYDEVSAANVRSRRDAYGAYIQGWQVNVHTIGDRANRVVIDAIESIVRGVPRNEVEGRFRLEHAQIMTERDIERAARLGGGYSTAAWFRPCVELNPAVIASFQPTHATSDVSSRVHLVCELSADVADVVRRGPPGQLPVTRRIPMMLILGQLTYRAPIASNTRMPGTLTSGQLPVLHHRLGC